MHTNESYQHYQKLQTNTQIPWYTRNYHTIISHKSLYQLVKYQIHMWLGKIDTSKSIKAIRYQNMTILSTIFIIKSQESKQSQTI